MQLCRQWLILKSVIWATLPYASVSSAVACKFPNWRPEVFSLFVCGGIDGVPTQCQLIMDSLMSFIELLDGFSSSYSARLKIIKNDWRSFRSTAEAILRFGIKKSFEQTEWNCYKSRFCLICLLVASNKPSNSLAFVVACKYLDVVFTEQSSRKLKLFWCGYDCREDSESFDT